MDPQGYPKTTEQKTEPRQHILYEDGDTDIPEDILDRNGEVVLGLCKVCFRAECELAEPCYPRPTLFQVAQAMRKNGATCGGTLARSQDEILTIFHNVALQIVAECHDIYLNTTTKEQK